MRTCALVVACLGLATVAAAEPAEPAMDPRAQVHLFKGGALYDSKDYAAAIAEFQLGYSIEPRREFLFAWAQAERLNGNCAAAISLFDRFLDTAPPQRQSDAARQLRAACERQVAPDTHAPAPPAVVAAPAAVAPPVVVTSSADLESPWYTDVLGDVAVVTGLSAAVVGVGFYAASRSSEDAAHRAPTQEDFQNKIHDAQTQRTVAIVGIAAGTSLIAAGALRYWWREPDTRPIASLSIAPHGSFVSFGVAF